MNTGRPIRLQGSRVAGVISCVPSRKVDNDFFFDKFGDKVAEVVKMTGVESRYWVDGDTTTSDLCARAAEELLARLDWPRDSIDAVIFLSQTPDYLLPATSCLLQARLGIRSGAICLDIASGCSGYVQALWLASSLVVSGSAKRILLAVGDTISRLANPDDRSTALLFGDAGSATAIEVDKDGQAQTFIIGGDGSGGSHLIVPTGCLARPTNDVRHSDVPPGMLFMDGGEVFNFTLKAVPKLINDTVEASGLTIDDHDFFLLHQANAFMIRHLAKKAKLPPDRVPVNIDRYGNTSSATLPLLMSDDIAGQLQANRCRIGLFGFGVGWSWGGASMDVGPLACAGRITL